MEKAPSPPSIVIGLRIPAAEWEAIKAAAAKERRSGSVFLRQLAAERIEKDRKRMERGK